MKDYIIQELIRLLPNFSIFFRIKRSLLQWGGVQVGEGTQIYQGVRISPLRGIIIGKRVAIGFDVLLRPEGGITIEDQVLVGHGTKILSANHLIPLDREPILGAGHKLEPVLIQKNAWIATNVIILPGVTVGEGGVVAAGSVVTKDVDDFTVVGGIPAKIIRIRD